LDAKGRINVPVRHRDPLVAACNGQLTLTRHPEGYLLLYPRPTWEAVETSLIRSLMRVASVFDSTADSALASAVAASWREPADARSTSWAESFESALRATALLVTS
jgi:DNA-binding transcriptional regulator/RsmH inhibitor MraZ